MPNQKTGWRIHFLYIRWGLGGRYALREAVVLSSTTNFRRRDQGLLGRRRLGHGFRRVTANTVLGAPLLRGHRGVILVRGWHACQTVRGLI